MVVLGGGYVVGCWSVGTCVAPMWWGSLCSEDKEIGFYPSSPFALNEGDAYALLDDKGWAVS